MRSALPAIVPAGVQRDAARRRVAVVQAERARAGVEIAADR
jgi:hypothetical protein